MHFTARVAFSKLTWLFQRSTLLNRRKWSSLLKYGTQTVRKVYFGIAKTTSKYFFNKCGKEIVCCLVDCKSGDVCISILHDPGEDKWGYERPEERWTPVHTVETIIVSVISMLADPNEQSPANVDAAVSIKTNKSLQVTINDAQSKSLLLLRCLLV